MNYPFMILDVPHDATDAQIQARYHELVERYPPDTAPEHFNLIRRAYESLNTEEKRRRARLFFFGQETPPRFDLVADTRRRERLDSETLARLLKGT